MTGDLFVMTGVLGSWIWSAYLMSYLLLLLIAEEHFWKSQREGLSSLEVFSLHLDHTQHQKDTHVFLSIFQTLWPEVPCSRPFKPHSFVSMRGWMLLCRSEVSTVVETWWQISCLWDQSARDLLGSYLQSHLAGNAPDWNTIFPFSVQRRSLVAWNTWAICVLR